MDSNGDEYIALDTFFNTVPHYQNISKGAYDDEEELKEIISNIFYNKLNMYVNQYINLIFGSS